MSCIKAGDDESSLCFWGVAGAGPAAVARLCRDAALLPRPLQKVIMHYGGARTVEHFGMAAIKMPEAAEPSLIGTTLGGVYRITRVLANGGMSAIYEALHLRLDQRVAVKVMASGLSSNGEALARFQREAEVTSHLRHPHFVTVMDFGTAPTGQPYLVMELLEGIDLDQHLRKVGRLPLPTVVSITKQAASALDAAHDQGIVHRDLKPANVFLVELEGEPEFVKILDFGISKVRAASSQLTKLSTVMGTPYYMSPEQATGMVDEIDHRTDQWALACIAWEMLSGRVPFAGDDMSTVFYQIIHLEPQPLSRHAPGLPPAVEAVLRRALSKSIPDRFRSIREFARALEDAATGEPVAEPLAQSANASGGIEVAESGASEAAGRAHEHESASVSEQGKEDLAATVRTGPTRKLKPIYAMVVAGVGLALVAVFSPDRSASPAKPAAEASATAAATAAPVPVPPPEIVPLQSLAIVPDSGDVRTEAPRLDSAGARPAARPTKPRPVLPKTSVGEAAGADPFASPFEPPRHPADDAPDPFAPAAPPADHGLKPDPFGP